MAAHAARRLKKMNENLNVILGVEMLCAMQGINFRAPLKTSEPLEKLVERFHRDVPLIDQDRYLAPDIVKSADLIATGAMIDDMNLPPFILGHQ